MPITPVPDPAFHYQGATLTLPAVKIGPFPVCPGRHVGTNFAADGALKVPDIAIRPVEHEVVEDDPCTVSFSVFYTQYRTDPLQGIEHEMVFRLTSDQAGGVVGVQAALDVTSNYDEIDMAIPRFEFSQPGFGILKKHVLPADYQATLTVRVWSNGVDVDVDGWARLECGYYRDEGAVDGNGHGNGAAGTGADEDARGVPLVAVGRASIYPAPPTPGLWQPRHRQESLLAST